MQVTIRQPETEQEWEQYFDCRWRMLRQPWKQERGSEKDELEESSIHCIAIIEKKIVAVGRLHFVDNEHAQIRYMAVTPNYQHQGIGHKILLALEHAAIKNNIKSISLNARENAIAFYEKNQYINIAPSHTLYNTIKHVKMIKEF